MGLFRQEALEAQRDRLQGQVVLLPHWPHAAVSIFLLLWVAAALIFLTQSNYSRRETVRGWLEPASGVIRIYPQSEGQLASLLVEAGDTVSAGQPLAVINGDRMLQGGEALDALLLREYQAQQEILQRQLQRSAILLSARRAELLSRIASGKAELGLLEEQQENLDRRTTLALTRQRRHLQLAASGHINQATLDDLYERILVLETDRRRLDLQYLRQKAQLRELDASLQRLPDEDGRETDQLQLELSGLVQDIARLHGRRAHVVQAPRDGKVGMVGIAVGQQARYGTPLLTLLPGESPLVARVLVPVRAAGFLEPGQQLAIRFDAYPYQKYGTHPARLAGVAHSTTLPSDRVNWPLAINEPVFRATAHLGSAQIAAHGERQPLKSGMTLSADVMLGHRSLLEWLLEPLYSLRGHLT